MSHVATAWAWLQDLPCPSKMVLLFLADAHNGSTNRCFPAIDTIVQACGISHSTAFKYLSEMEAAGLITRKAVFLDNGKQTSNEYVLHFDGFVLGSTSRRVGLRETEGEAPGDGYKPGSGNREEESTLSGTQEPSGRAPRFVPRRVNTSRPSPHQFQIDKEAHRWDVKIPAVLQPVVDKWCSIAVKHHQGTRVLHDGIRALRQLRSGTFFSNKKTFDGACRQYTLDEINKALDRFDKMRNDPNYLPHKKDFLRRVSLPLFFFDPHMVNGHGTHGGSLFLECLQRAPGLAADQNPELTEYVQEKYYQFKKEALPRPQAARLCARLSRVWKENQLWLKQHDVRSVKLLCQAWMRVLSDRHGVTWGVGNMLTEAAWNSLQDNLRRN